MLTSLLLAALSLNSLAAFDTTKLPEHGTDIGGPTITSADQACHDMLVRAEDTLVRVEAYEAWRINDHQAKFACRDTHYGETGFHGVSTDGNWHFTCPPDKPFVHVALANSLQPGEPQHSKARCHKYKWPGP